MSDDYGLLIETLLPGLDESDRKVAGQYLDGLLGNEQTVEDLLSNDHSNSDSIMHLIANLENNFIQIDNKINTELSRNIDTILDNNDMMIQGFNLLDTLSSELDTVDIPASIISSLNTGNANTGTGDIAKQRYNSTSFHVTDNTTGSSLHSLDYLIELMELPTIAHKLIKSSKYEECIELSSIVKNLNITFNNFEAISTINKNVNYEIVDMVKKLLLILTTNVKQSSILKILNYLKKVLNNQILQSLFLNCRLLFIVEELNNLAPLKQSNLVEKYIKQSLEIFREFTFQSIITFKSVFEMDSKLVYNFTNILIIKICDIVADNIREISSESAQDSILLQLMYCCQSLSRIGADFTTIVIQKLSNSISASRLISIISKQRRLKI